MSGGIAYVYDADGDFHVRCNQEMVDLEKLDDAEDLDLVHGLLKRHRQYTGSTVGEWMLADWPKIAKKFVKVMPKDYKRVLQEQLKETRKVKAAAKRKNGSNGKNGRSRKTSTATAKKAARG
jgi:glutamate synthase (ferredoxin)